MSCQCVISADGADRVESICQEMRTARKPHRCTECGDNIEPGERYEYFYGKFDGERFSYHTCVPCVEIRAFFSCDGSWMWGSVWDDMEHLFDDFHHGCLDPQDDREPLSARAKAKVVERWQQWKGLRAR